MTKRGRKRVERRWALHCTENGFLVPDPSSGHPWMFTFREEAADMRRCCDIPVRVTLTWEEPPRKEKRHVS